MGRGFFWLLVLGGFGIAAWLFATTITVIPQKQLCFADLIATTDQKGCVWVAVADTPAEMAKGLSGKWWMPESVGMWFVFPEADVPTFWMKEMRFGLDFIWIRDGQVVDVTANVGKPHVLADEKMIISPKMPADSVVEVNAGWVERHKVQVGDTVVVRSTY